jgi:serine/threonine-protein kinase
MALHEGAQIGPYRLVEQLGVGGMAAVYKAYHEKLDRFVAIKVMHQAFLEDPNFQARFEREARIVARLEHPNIVPVYDFSEYENQPYLVMKYIEGETLKRKLSRERALSLEEIVRIMTAVADALTYAHENGVLHRDIKPSNIILDERGMPYLTDFGLARMAQAAESTMSQDMLLGTPHYISPEQAKGGIELTPRADVYSLGVVLYELVVGQVPFNAVTPYAIVHDHIYTPLPLPSRVNPEIPKPVENVLVKALSKNPPDRYASAREMLTAFRAAVQQSNLKSLNPERASLASESLAQMRRAESLASTPVDPQNAPDSAETMTLDESAVPVPPPFPGAPMPPRPPRPPRKPKSPDPDEDPAEYAKWKMQDAMGKASSVLDEVFPSGRTSRKLSRAMEKVERRIEKEIDRGNIQITVGDEGKVHWEKPDGEENLDEGFSEEAIRRRIDRRFRKRAEFVAHLGSFIAVNLICWFLWNNAGVNLGWAFPWPLFVTFGWGAGLASDMMETVEQTGRRAEAREDAIEREMNLLYGNNWSYTTSQDQYRQVRKRIAAEFHKRAEFFQNLAAFVFIIPLMWLLWGNGLKIFGDFPWPLLIMGGWGLGIASEGVQAFLHPSSRSAAREQAIQREIERERRRLGMDASYAEESAKRKNEDADRHVRLTEDGELTDSFAQEWDEDEDEKRKRG